MIHMKCQALFYLKKTNNNKNFKMSSAAAVPGTLNMLYYECTVIMSKNLFFLTTNALLLWVRFSFFNITAVFAASFVSLPFR